jgi:hypothetical protein
LVEEKSVMEQGERGFYVGQNVGMYIVGMHIHIVPNRGASPTVLLRESYRDGRTVKKRTLANLSSLPPAQVETIRAALRGEALRPVHQSCEIIQSRAHGHLAAVAQTMRRLGMALVVAATPCREWDLVLAMVAPRILAPHTKLGTTRWWHTTTLPSNYVTVEPGDVLLTGTCAGAMDSIVQPGDEVIMSIEGIGSLQTTFV